MVYLLMPEIIIR